MGKNNKSKSHSPSFLIGKFSEDYYPNDNGIVYCNVPRHELYGLLSSGIFEEKFIEVNDELGEEIFKKNKKHSNSITDTQIIDRSSVVSGILNSSHVPLDKIKYIKTFSHTLCFSELGGHTEPEYLITNITVVVSKKDPSRILGITYTVNNNGVIFHRYFIRYSTLTKHTKSACKVLKTMKNRALKCI